MRIVPARNGWLWLVKGFALFRRSPAMWLALVLAYWIIMALLAQIQYIGLALSTVLLPAFSVSFMIMCAVLDRGGALNAALLFSGFRNGLSTLIALGGLYMVSLALVLAIASLADGGALLQWVLSGQEPPIETVRDGSVSRAMLLASVAGAPVLIAFWFAPLLAAWDRMGALQSLFYSFFAGWRNWRAFLFYGAALALAGAAFLALVAAAMIATRGRIEVLRHLAPLVTLLTMPIVLGSSYASYRDVFPEGRIPAERAD